MGTGSEDVVEEEIGVVLNGAIVVVILEPLMPKTTWTPFYQQPLTMLATWLLLLHHHQVVWGLLICGIPLPTETYLQMLTPLPHSCYDFDRFRLYSRDRSQSVSDNAQAYVQGAS